MLIFILFVVVAIVVHGFNLYLFGLLYDQQIFMCLSEYIRYIQFGIWSIAQIYIYIPHEHHKKPYGLDVEKQFNFVCLLNIFCLFAKMKMKMFGVYFSDSYYYYYHFLDSILSGFLTIVDFYFCLIYIYLLYLFIFIWICWWSVCVCVCEKS